MAAKGEGARGSAMNKDEPGRVEIEFDRKITDPGSIFPLKIHAPRGTMRAYWWS